MSQYFKYITKNKSKIFYSICLIFIFSGAVNYGFSRFIMAIPFMWGALWIGKKLGIGILTMIICGLSILCNFTLEKNPLIFPILRGGEVTFLYDGNIVVYEDKSGGFVKGDTTLPKCVGCGTIQEYPIKKGQTIKVLGVNISHPDFGTDVGLITELGPISQINYKGESTIKQEKTVETNKNVTTQFTEYLSLLMIYPALPFIGIAMIYSIPHFLF